MVQFDPSWVSKTEKQHLVPNTYLKAWSTNNDHVYYIEKNEKTVDFTQVDFQKRTKTLTIIKEFYSRNIYSYFFENGDLEEIFKPITAKNYSVKLEGKDIKELIDLRNVFYEFNKWDIYDSRQMLILEEDKQLLKKEIKDVQIRNIEEGWNRMFENAWPSTREALLQAVQTNPGVDKINSVKREELVRFMVATEWRTFPPHPSLLSGFDRLTTLVGKDFINTLNEQLEEEEKYLSVINTNGEHFLHDLSLKYFLEYLNNAGPIYNEFLYIFNNMDIELLVPEAGSEFITSDNPVRTFTNSDNEVEYIFPICPTLACAVRKNGKNQDKSKYLVTAYSKERTIKFNTHTKQSSYKGYVVKQPNLTSYFG